MAFVHYLHGKKLVKLNENDLRIVRDYQNNIYTMVSQSSMTHCQC